MFEENLAKFGETPNIPQTFAENLMFGVMFVELSSAVAGPGLSGMIEFASTILAFSRAILGVTEFFASHGHEPG